MIIRSLIIDAHILIIVVIAWLCWRTSFFVCWHKWEFMKEYGFTYMKLKCKRCGRLKVKSQ
jgi:hypothetical protein